MCGKLEQHSHEYASDQELNRRTLLGGTAIAVAAALTACLGATPAIAQVDPYPPPAEPALPPSYINLNLYRFALLVTDPPIDFLSPDGYLAGLIKFRFMANAVWTTSEAVARLSK